MSDALVIGAGVRPVPGAQPHPTRWSSDTWWMMASR